MQSFQQILLTKQPKSNIADFTSPSTVLYSTIFKIRHELFFKAHHGLLLAGQLSGSTGHLPIFIYIFFPSLRQPRKHRRVLSSFPNGFFRPHNTLCHCVKGFIHHFTFFFFFYSIHFGTWLCWKTINTLCYFPFTEWPVIIFTRPYSSL